MKQGIPQLWAKVGLLFLVLCVSPFVRAESFEKDGIAYSPVSDTEVRVISKGWASYSGDMVIPATVSNAGLTYSVTGIGSGAFRSCTSLFSILLPESITMIGDTAFHYCENLLSVNFPSRLESIGRAAFYYCQKIDSLTIPGHIKTIGDNAFKMCHLQSLVIEDGVASIGDFAFMDCSKSISTLSIPQSVQSIGKGAFSSMYELVNIKVDPANARYTSVDGMLFSKDLATLLACPKKKEIQGTYYIPDGVKELLPYAFYGATNLTSVVIPGSLASIDESVFADCFYLESVLIKNGVLAVNSTAFNNCFRLASLTFPQSVQNIYIKGEFAFGSLQEFIVHPDNAHYSSLNGGLFNKDRTVLLAYPRQREGAFIIPQGVQKITARSFYYCRNLTSVEVPGSVTVIGDSAFHSSSLASIHLVDGVTEIRPHAFYGCDSLASISIPGSVQSIGNYAFYSCKKLTSVHIPGSVQSIGDNAFQFCNNLTSLTFDEGLQYLRGWAFADCEKLDIVTLPNTLSILGDRVFYNCSGLLSITFGRDVTIGEAVLAKCSALEEIIVSPANGLYCVDKGVLLNSIKTRILASTNVNKTYTVPETVTTIVNGAFHRCTNLQSVILPEGLKIIKGSAFSECRGLTSIVIPGSVTSIGDWAFSDCTGATSLTFLESPEADSEVTIGNYTFYNCPNMAISKLPHVTSIGNSAFAYNNTLTSITLPESINSIGYSVFYTCDKLETVYAKRTDPLMFKLASDNPFEEKKQASQTLYVPTGSKALYEAAKFWQNFGTILEMDFSSLDTPLAKTDVVFYIDGTSLYIDKEADIDRVELYTSSGQQLYTVAPFAGSIDLSALPAGTYYVRAYSGDTCLTGKFQKTE